MNRVGTLVAVTADPIKSLGTQLAVTADVKYHRSVKVTLMDHKNTVLAQGKPVTKTGRLYYSRGTEMEVNLTNYPFEV